MAETGLKIKEHEPGRIIKPNVIVGVPVRIESDKARPKSQGAC